VAALACVGTIAPAAPAAESPRAVVEATTSAVIAVLADKSLSTDEKRRRVEEIVYARVDFDTLSRLVLGRSWNQLSEEQRAEFEREFKQNLSATYGRNVESYKNEKVTIIDDRQEARGDWTVRTKIVRHGPDDISVDYRLRQTGGTWKIIDVIIEGVSLVSNYRSQFQEIMANGGIDRLLKLLREKNARGEPLPAPKGATGPDQR
jgi:phospholipid transport system substrate-binding protein